MDPLSTDTVSGQSRIKVWRAVLCVILSLLLILPPDLAHAAEPLRGFLDPPTAILPVPDDGTDDFASDDDADDSGGFDFDGATDGSDALSTTGSADDPASEKPYIVGEEEGFREQNVKHFRLSDGSHVACDYGMPVHYRADDGTLKDIDATLIRGEEGYSPANSVIDVTLPEDIAKSEGVALDDGVSPISWRYDVLPAFEKPVREGDGAEDTAGTGDSGATDDGGTGASATTGGDASAGDTTGDTARDRDGAEEPGAGDATGKAPGGSDADTGNPAGADGGAGDAAGTGKGTAPATDGATGTTGTPAQGAEPGAGITPAAFTRSSRNTAPALFRPMADITSKVTRTTDDLDTRIYIPFKRTARSLESADATAGDERFTVLQNLNSRASYRTIAQGVGLEYITTPLGVKENVILKDEAAPSEYTVLYLVGELEAEQVDPRTVVFKDADGNVSWSVSAPVMTDAKGETSETITLEIVESAEDSVRLKISADRAWLSDPARSWPVKLDPTVFSEKLNDWYQGFTYESGGGGYNMGNGSTYVGRMGDYGVTRMYVWKDTRLLPQIPASSAIIGSTIGFVKYAYQVSPPDRSMPVTAHRVLQVWRVAEIGRAGFGYPPHSDPIDYKTISNSSEYEYVTWDITRATSDWYAQWWDHGDWDNYGVMFKSSDESTPWRTQFISANNPSFKPEVWPFFTVTYRNQIGLESYWTTHTQDLDRSGTGHIKDMTTTLTWVHPDVSLSAGVNSIGLSHVYNSNGRASNPSASNPGLLAGRVGRNWNLSAVQRLVENKDAGTAKNYPFIYIDADSTEHYICGAGSDIDEKARNKDEDGLGLTYAADGGGVRRLTTKDDVVMYFNSAGNLFKVTDANGNTTTYTYATCKNDQGDARGGNDYLTAVRTSDDKVVKLSWEKSGSVMRLNTISDIAGRATTYSYTGEQLTKITYPDETATTFSYEGDLLVAVTSPDGSKITYTVDGKGRYTSAGETGASGTVGHGYDMVRSGYLQTTFTETQGGNATNSPKETYQFNTFGNTTCAYNSEGMAVSQSFSNTRGWTNHALKSSSTAGRTTVNLFKNPTLAGNREGWDTLATGSVSLTSEQMYSGARSLKLSNATSEQYATTAQSVKHLPSGRTYTASAYFKTTEVEGAGTAIQVWIDGKVAATSGRITGTTDVNVNGGWQRSSVTFTVPQDSVVDAVRFGLYYSKGTAYVTGMQLERGGVADELNLFYDSGFEAGEGNSSVAHTGKSGRSIRGNFTATYKVTSALFPLGLSGKPSDTYVFGGWGRSKAVASGTFEITLAVTYDDDTVRYIHSDFNKNVEDWQFTMKATEVRDPSKPTMGYKKIDLFLDYHNQAGIAYFDDIFVYRDNAEAYSHDKDGNLVTAKDAAASSTKFDYTAGSISKMVSPSGTSYEYNLDQGKNPLLTKSAEGVAYQMGFDAKGNPVLSDVLSATRMTMSLIEGKTYYIRNVATGKYMDIQGGSTSAGASLTQYVHNGTLAQQFGIEAAGGGYYLIVPRVAPTLVLDVDGGSKAHDTRIQTYTRNNTDSQKFKITPAQGYGYRITSKITEDDSAFTIKNASQTLSETVIQYRYGTGLNQHWYFEEVKKERSDDPVADGVYFMRTVHSGQYLDIAGGSDANGTILTQYPYNATRAQRFRLLAVSEDYMKLAPVHAPGKVLTEQDDKYPGSGTYRLTLQPDTSAAAQQFKFVKNDDGSYRVESRLRPGRLLDVANAGYGISAPVGIGADSDHDCRKFVLERIRGTISSSATYDETGSYLTGTVDVRGNKTAFSYDVKKGLLTSSTDAKGGVTSYTYDAQNDRLLSTAGAGVKVENAYTSTGLLSSITHNGFSYGFTYDEFKNPTGVTAGGTTLVTHTYAANNGDLAGSIYGNGAKITYAYDKYHRVIKRQWEGGKASTVTYDSKGDVYKTYDGMTGVTTNYTYDLIGRPLSSTSSSGLKMWTAYDGRNRVGASSYQIAGSPAVKTSYVYGNSAGTTHTSMIYGVAVNDTRKLTYAYDALGRRTETKATTPNLTTTYRYINNSDGTTTSLVAGVTNGSAPELTYVYDKVGNITQIKSGATVKKTYAYDALSRLTREDDADAKKTYTYAYDTGGNITEKRTYAYTTATLGAVTETLVYSYPTSGWKDQLVKLTTYKGDPKTVSASSTKSFVYDRIGNPTTYGDKAMTWQNGRSLKTVKTGTTTTTYTYDDSGVRTSKTVGDVKTTYVTTSSRVLRQTSGDTVLDFYYDETGSAFALKYKGVEYHYVKNAQGDVTGIIDSTGKAIVAYTYDAWGNPIATTGSLASTLGKDNPLRYRGYVYDTETGFYYLQSRYYDPSIGRMLNADTVSVIDVQKDFFDKNLYAYCDNNPVVRMDKDGRLWDTVFDVISLGVSIAGVVANPSDPMAWAAVGADVVSLAVPGLTGGGTIVRAVSVANKAPDVIKALPKPKIHANSLKTTKPAIGYALRKNDTGKVMKFGETTRGVKRYSQSFYKRHNVYMDPMAKGSKWQMHFWQRRMIVNYKMRIGVRPPWNKSDW